MMAPDRGQAAGALVKRRASPSVRDEQSHASTAASPSPTGQGPRPNAPRDETDLYLAQRADEPQNFTLRGILVGLAIGTVICFSNMYFGLQTGWVSSMAMPSALIGFAYFRLVSRYLAFPFTPVENVLIQSVAGSVGTMPLGCGFVGVVPALNFLLSSEENGPLNISLWKLIVWSVGICFFGVVFAVPLRREVIIREKLKFPSGTATALMIGVLHGDKGDAQRYIPISGDGHRRSSEHEQERLLSTSTSLDPVSDPNQPTGQPEAVDALSGFDSDWKAKIRLLVISFGVSALYTLVSYFLPQVRDVPILGLTLASDWLWTLNPSPAYVGQGIIMGPTTTLHMLFGAIIGWGVLSPLAKYRKWAPGPVNDWETGSKGWIVWISLAIMLADSLVSLGWLVLRPTIQACRIWYPIVVDNIQRYRVGHSVSWNHRSREGYSSLNTGHSDPSENNRRRSIMDEPEADAPPEHLISNRTTAIGLALSLGLCAAAVHYAFPGLIPFHLTLLALVLALLLSIMGVRALGETDLNPVSGISKLTQLLFALVTPTSGPAAKNAIIVNLLAGAISESGALQAGDLLQDLKTGHLLGAAPKAQFWGQIIGSAFGAVVSAFVYKLYVNVYDIPGGMFQIPTGYVWVFTARLVTGQGLPDKVAEWATGSAIVFALLTVLRIVGSARKSRGKSAQWVHWIPGGIAVAVGMYNTPSFTLARAIGGTISLYWRHYKRQPETPIIIAASGLILGEGLFSIVNLLLASLKVPHL